MLTNEHILDIICGKVQGASIVNKITAYLCNHSRKKARILPIFSEISAYLWNQRERKNYIFKESAMRKIHIAKTIQKVRVMKIYVETIS